MQKLSDERPQNYKDITFMYFNPSIAEAALRYEQNLPELFS